MGTLLDQSVYRSETSFEDTYKICSKIEDLMVDWDFTFEQALEIVKLSVKIRDYDVKDEQLAGFGQLLEAFVYAVAGIADKIGENECDG
nr:MAG: hypothetical protein [Bacteriophage sp.]